MPQIVIGENGENSDVAEGVFSDEEEEEAVKDEEVEEELIEEAFAISEAGVEDKHGKKLQLSKVDSGRLEILEIGHPKFGQMQLLITNTIRN